MLEVVIGGIMYTASLLGCYDGDTCKIEVEEFVPFTVWSLRLEGFDTPEMRGKCDSEKELAKEAQEATLAYMLKDDIVIVVSGREKYGRLLSTVDGLAKHLIERDLAKPYDGGARESWCD